MLTTTPTTSGLVSTLAWLIPIGGLVVWVLILPSTRALLRSRIERRATAETTESAHPTPESKPAPRARIDDPEIRRFDREVVRAKFARSESAKTGS